MSDPLKDRLARLDAHIRFEFELTAQRVGYLASSQAFLFTAYGFASANQMESAPQLGRIVSAVPWLGMVLSAVVLVAVVASEVVTHKLKSERRSLGKQLEAAGLDVDPVVENCSVPHWLGLLPPVFAAGGFLACWLFVWGVCQCQ